MASPRLQARKAFPSLTVALGGPKSPKVMSDLTSPGGTRREGLPEPTAHIVIRLAYTYFFIPVWALAAALSLNIFLQLFFVSVLPLLDKSPSLSMAAIAHDSVTVAANLLLVLLFPFPATRVVSNIAGGCSGSSPPLVLAVIVAAMAALPTLIAPALAAVDAWPTQIAGLIYAVVALFALQVAHIAACFFAHKREWFGHSSAARECHGWEMRATARFKAIHVFGSAAIGLRLAGAESPLHSLSCILVVTTASTAALVIAYLVLKLAFEICSLPRRALVYPLASLPVAAAAAASAVTVALTSIAHASPYLTALTAAGCGVVAFANLTIAVKSKDQLRQAIPERRHIIFSMFWYRTLMYGGLVLLGLLIVGTHIQEAAVVDTCFLAPDHSKFELLAFSPPPQDYLDHLASRATAASGPGYAGCHIRNDGLDLVETALLADIATVGYGSCWNLSRSDLLAAVLPSSDWTELGASAPDAWVGFVHLHSPSRDLHVLAARGTIPHRFIDLIQDISLYSSVVAIQGISFLVPLTAWPRDATALLVYTGSLIHELFPSSVVASKRDYYRSLEAYLTSYRTAHPSASFLLTGHSLGGALAKIVGARHALPAVAFSSPGIVLSRLKFGVSAAAINAAVTNVVPSNDMIPLVDLQGGVVVNVGCSSPSPGKCHEVERTLCEINAVCGLGYDHLGCHLFDATYTPPPAPPVA
ncbi:uncharacterized protein AMSG_11532 [Thecamonas trahens ATCC 50062]|uniref:Fungal lipase-type domain-containing protein n=1 Tax=Thecamonas trahens ATCC 50062 TaxID=461836 RepID=A0A0L0DWN7_THETB|nr:hypothetical protein AMSG_11532 [Thecamonas trahens ATCC 50062]KNC56511.1 hypothetical protein AMSG_11532 [Thecamonas trahens ATCC 50062]|eukprot:XP_013752617.1 hypothetical protein AMSG_11532 [Thecamonas trahens ATCC 50062]